MRGSPFASEKWVVLRIGRWLPVTYLYNEKSPIFMTNQMACRVVIAYKTGLLGRGLQSLLEHAGAFEVAAVFGADEGLAGIIRYSTPDAIIVENGALSSENAQAVLTTALAHPNMSVVSVSLDEAKPTLFRGLSVVAEGNETVADALRRHLTVPP